MKTRISGFILFAAGAAVGSAATWKIVKTKYERIAQEEIDSVKEAFAPKNIPDERIDDFEKKNDQEMAEYAKTLSDTGYVVTNRLNELERKIEEKGEPVTTDGPYVISPEEFGDLDDYETISLTYYADNVLADDMDEIVDDPEEVVGLDSLERFGEYEEDSVHVRNDEKHCDYEILRDLRNYADVVGMSPPHLVEK